MTLPLAGWEPPPVPPVLGPHQVHVWRVLLDQPGGFIDQLYGTLSQDERGRADRFRSGRLRRHFVAGRGSLRVILAGYLGCDPRGLTFGYGKYGKPELVQTAEAGDLRFNLSHSGGMALLGVTRGREIGIDLEQVRPLADFEGMAGRFFAPREVADLAGVPQAEREKAFFNCWTRKEAYIKACGEGLFRALDQFVVSVRPAEPARLVHVEGDPNEACRWSLREVDPGPGYVGCVAVAGAGWDLRRWAFQALPLP